MPYNLNQMLKDHVEQTTKRMGRFLNHQVLLTRVVEKMEKEVEPIATFFTVRLDETDVNISISGDSKTLTKAIKILRSEGLSAREKPQPNKPDYNQYFTFRNEEQVTDLTGPSIFLVFSSTKCKLVQTGSKWVEQPIYSVECEG